MQVNTLTKDNNPGPNRRLMQQAFTRQMHGTLPLSPHNWVLKVPPGFAKLLHTPGVGCQLHKKNRSRRH
jgi:hypothetical protein